MKNERQNLKSRINIHQTLRNLEYFEFPFYYLCEKQTVHYFVYRF